MDLRAPPVSGTKTLLSGFPGAGKTHAIRTLLEIPWLKNIHVTFLEDGRDIIADLPDERLHYAYLPAMQTSWESLRTAANIMHSATMKGVQELSGIDRAEHDVYLKLVDQMIDWKCDRCGKSFGNVGSWGLDTVHVVDSASGLNIISMDNVVGSKPLKTLPEWGSAIDLEERFINLCTFSSICHFVLITHLDRDTDITTGSVGLFPAMLGSKLGTRVGRFFKDVIQAKCKAGVFTWNALAVDAENSIKTRNLPIAAGQQPNFKPLFDAWAKKVGYPPT